MKSKINVCLSTILIVLFVLNCGGTKEIYEAETLSYSYEMSEWDKDVNSVVRNHETELEYINQNSAVLRVKEAITILDKEDKHLANVYLYYDKFRSIDFINANIIDKDGNLVRSFTSEDAYDFSSADGYTFFSDSRVKLLELFHNDFPYTIVTDYQIKYNGLLNLPTWYPLWYGQVVEQSELRIIDRTNGSLKYHADGFEDKPTISDSTIGKIYTWNFSNDEPMMNEPLSPPAPEVLPKVLVAPLIFEIENTYGSTSSWQEFGQWYYLLGKNERVLSDAAKREVDAVIDGVENEKQKVKALYKYLQQKTRYVSIQLGIGGWKPFSADYVFNNEYGDCKALTNFMQAVLEYAGIESHPVLIRNGADEPDLITDFPSSQFNHVILRVTLSDGEHVWLECTSAYMPFGSIGNGNENKQALLVKPTGGELIETPKRSYSQNNQEIVSHVLLSKNGGASINVTIKSEGVVRDQVLHEILPKSEKERVEWLSTSYDIPNSDIIDINFEDLINDDSNYNFDFSFEKDSYASTSSKRLFVPVNVLSNWNISFSNEDDRKFDVWLPVAFQEKDSTVFNIPEGFVLEGIPKSERIENSFASYNGSFEKLDSNNVLFTRSFSIKSRKLKPEEYPDFINFMNEVSRLDNQQMVLVLE